MTVGAVLTATFEPIANVHGLTGKSVVALPPSTTDPSADRMRVYVNDFEIARPYDPATDLA